MQNPCLSGGSLEIFLEPMLASPRVLVVGDTPIAGAVARMGAELDLDMVVVAGADVEPAADDLALVVAAHGRDELSALRRGLEAGLPYVGLVASRVRGSAVVAELHAEGLAEERLARLETPAGLDIGARTPEEIALSILARIVAVRRGEQTLSVRVVAPAAARTAEPGRRRRSIPCAGWRSRRSTRRPTSTTRAGASTSAATAAVPPGHAHMSRSRVGCGRN